MITPLVSMVEAHSADSANQAIPSNTPAIDPPHAVRE
jgi:hypothetical protein